MIRKYFCYTGVLLLFFIVIAPFAIALDSQNKVVKPKTELEAVLLTRGKLIVKSFSGEGGLYSGDGRALFRGLTVYEPGRNVGKVKGLHVTITEERPVSLDRSLFLDIDEVLSLIKAIDYMEKLANRWKTIDKEYVEVLFSTRGDFTLGFYQRKQNQVGVISSKYPKVAITFPIEDIDHLQNLLRNILEELESVVD